MGRIVDLTGKQFSRWNVIGLSHNKDGVLFWDCRCECGTERKVFGGDLKREVSKSCGCLMVEKSIERFSTHNMSRHLAYRSWICMRDRCENQNNTGYYLYGARGIKVCERWNDFNSFWEDMGPTWQKGLSIDRIDSDGNYEPLNCKWSTAREQANNRRTNRLMNTPVGRMNIGQASIKYGIPRGTISARLNRGWSDFRAIDCDEDLNK